MKKKMTKKPESFFFNDRFPFLLFLVAPQGKFGRVKKERKEEKKEKRDERRRAQVMGGEK